MKNQEGLKLVDTCWTMLDPELLFDEEIAAI